MALNYFSLVPSADISVGHALYPADSPNAYSLLSDSDTNTYISTSGVAGETVVQTSSFKMSGNVPSDMKVITGARIVIEAITNLNQDLILWEASATLNGTNFKFNPADKLNTITGLEYANEDFVAAINKCSIPSSEITITITSTTSQPENSKIWSNQIVTRTRIALYYSTGIGVKVNGKWKMSHNIYRKSNGVWEPIDNGYNVIGTTLHKSGHHQEYLASVSPTCTETGLTAGYKCAICGEFFVPQQVIPANGHDYITSGGHRVCDVCDYVEGLGFVELAYHGTITALSKARGNLASTTVGNYALFGGGYNSDSRLSTVDAYDTSLTRTTPTELSKARSNLASTTVGNYALFGGGYNGSDYYSTVDAYNTSLTRTIPTELSEGRNGLAATTVGNYALFGGGYNGGSSTATVDAYDTSLTKKDVNILNSTQNGLAATTVGNYALFGGGVSKTDVTAYDHHLTKTIPTGLTDNSQDLEAVAVGNYALFGGGRSGSGSAATIYSTVYAYKLQPI